MAKAKKLPRPKKNSLWSRKDARRPGVVKVTGFVKRTRSWGTPWIYVKWEDTASGRKGEVLLGQWHRRYTAFVAPEPSIPTHNDEPGK